MKIGKALRVVMARWNLTGYRLAKVAGMDRSAIAKLMRGDYQSAMWGTVDQITDAFEKIDPIAGEAFLTALRLPDGAYPELDGGHHWVAAEEDPEAIKRVIEALLEMGLSPEELDRVKRSHAFTTRDGRIRDSFESRVSFKMQERRLAQEEEVNDD